MWSQKRPKTCGGSEAKIFKLNEQIETYSDHTVHTASDITEQSVKAKEKILNCKNPPQ